MIQALHRKWRQEQNLRPGGYNKGAKYTSNKTHYSPVDPDARIAVKPGKARRLCYHMQLAVDAGRHVITHVQADHADRKDSRCLPFLLAGLTQRLQCLGFRCTALLADTGYSSGENYALLEREGIAAFIPAHGKYTGGPEGFTYEREGGYWLCPEGKKATFRQEIIKVKGNQVQSRLYRTTRGLQGLPLKGDLLRQTARKENRHLLLPRRVRKVHRPGPQPLGPAHEAAAAGDGGAGIGHAFKLHGHAKGQYPRAGVGPQRDAPGRRGLNLQKLLHFSPRRSQTAVMALPWPEQRVLFGLFLGEAERWSLKKGIEIRN